MVDREWVVVGFLCHGMTGRAGRARRWCPRIAAVDRRAAAKLKTGLPSLAGGGRGDFSFSIFWNPRQGFEASPCGRSRVLSTNCISLLVLQQQHAAMKPYWILRHHGSSSIRSLHHDHHSLVVGDETGAVSIVDLHHLRPTVRWNAHTDSILTVISLGDHVLTHSRDNNVHLWKLPHSPPALGTLSQVEGAHEPQLIMSVGVNALNFSKCAYDDGRIAVPNALDAAYIDVIELPSGVRVVEAIGRPDVKRTAGSRMPIVMSLHLVAGGVVAGYEDGWVKRWSLDGELVWQTRCHSESCQYTHPSPAMVFATQSQLTICDHWSSDEHGDQCAVRRVGGCRRPHRALRPPLRRDAALADQDSGQSKRGYRSRRQHLRSRSLGRIVSPSSSLIPAECH